MVSTWLNWGIWLFSLLRGGRRDVAFVAAADVTREEAQAFRQIRDRASRSSSSFRIALQKHPSRNSPLAPINGPPQPDGVFLSNGPGDPAPVTYAVETIRNLLALALGARTYKLKFGHHGANHPVKNLETGKIKITTLTRGSAAQY